MLGIERRSRGCLEVSARGYLTDRELAGDRTRGKGRLQIVSAAGQEAADVRQADRSLAGARAGERGSFYKLQFVKAALPGGFEIIDSHAGAVAHNPRLRATRKIGFARGTADHPYGQAVAHPCKRISRLKPQTD